MKKLLKILPLGLAIALLLAWPGKSQTPVKYFYVVTAFDATGIESMYSNELAVTPDTSPTAKHTVPLVWNASTSTVAGYYVYRGTSTGGPYTRIGSTATLAYTDVFTPPNPPTGLAGVPN